MKSIAFLFLLSFACAVQAQLKIVTTAPDYADIAKQIGDDKVDVHSVMKGPENVHNVIANPTQMVFLHDADLFVGIADQTNGGDSNLLVATQTVLANGNRSCKAQKVPRSAVAALGGKGILSSIFYLIPWVESNSYVRKSVGIRQGFVIAQCSPYNPRV